MCPLARACGTAPRGDQLARFPRKRLQDLQRFDLQTDMRAVFEKLTRFGIELERAEPKTYIPHAGYPAIAMQSDCQ